MGEPKQLLRLGVRTVLGQTLDNLRRARVEEIVLVLGFSAEAIKRQIAVEGVKVVINEQFREGMVARCDRLTALDTEINAALIVLADQPFVSSATFNQLIDRYIETGAQIAIPTYRGFRVIRAPHRSVFTEVMPLVATSVPCHLRQSHERYREVP